MASEAAVRRVRDEPEESVDVLEAELSVARMSGVGDAAGAEVSDDELDAMLRELAEEEAAQAAARARAEEAEAAGRGTTRTPTTRGRRAWRVEPPTSTAAGDATGDAGTGRVPTASR